MKWFEQKPRFSTLKGKNRAENVPDGLYFQCPECSSMIYRKEIDKNFGVCENCGYHTRLPAQARIEMLLDPGSFLEDNAELKPVDILQFQAKRSYKDQIKNTIEQTGINEGVITGSGRIMDMSVILAVMDFRFLGGSMGSVVGEKVTRAMERALQEEVPIITVTTTGGARMMEAIVSLMQMAKTSAACAKLDAKGIPFISILTDPSMAGVMASFAALGDLIIAEPGCMVGFAGRRVIEQTVREHLPKGFQTAEFVQDHGFIDLVVHRQDMRNTLSKVLNMLWGKHAVSGNVVPITVAEK